MKAVAAAIWFLSCAAFAQAQPVEDLIKEGDAFDAKNQNAEALAIYLKAEKLQPSNPDILRLISKQYAQQMVDAGQYIEIHPSVVPSAKRKYATQISHSKK